MPHAGFSGTPRPCSKQDEPACVVLQELSTLGLGSDAEVDLRTLQLPVDYKEVKQTVIRIWEDLQPQVKDGGGVGGLGADNGVRPQRRGTPGPRF